MFEQLGFVYDWISYQLSFPFVRKGLLAGLFLSAAFAPVSIFAVQRRLGLAGDALAHGTLPGIFVAYGFFGLSTIALSIGGFLSSLLIVILASIFSWRSLFKADSVLGAVYIAFFAIGGVLVSTGKTSLNLQEFLIGSPLGITWPMIYVAVGAALISWIAIALLYRPLILQSQDPAFFASIYRHGWWVTQGFMAIFVMVLIAAVNVFGTLLAIAFIILPPLAARCWVNSVSKIIILNFVFGFIASIGGMVASLIFDNLPAGPVMVLVTATLWLVSYLCGPFGLRLSFHTVS